VQWLPFTRAIRRIWKTTRGPFQFQTSRLAHFFAIEGSIVGLELFNAAATYRKLSRKLILSYALDAMEHSTNSAVPDLEAAQLFAGSVRTAQSQRFEAAGVGESVRLTSTKVSGAALEFNGACLHLAAFSRTASDQEKH
jgi:hypothetical protein